MGRRPRDITIDQISHECRVVKRSVFWTFSEDVDLPVWWRLVFCHGDERVGKGRFHHRRRVRESVPRWLPNWPDEGRKCGSPIDRSNRSPGIGSATE